MDLFMEMKKWLGEEMFGTVNPFSPYCLSVNKARRVYINFEKIFYFLNQGGGTQISFCVGYE